MTPNAVEKRFLDETRCGRPRRGPSRHPSFSCPTGRCRKPTPSRGSSAWAKSGSSSAITWTRCSWPGSRTDEHRRLAGGAGRRRLAALGVRIAVAGVRGRQPEPAKSGTRQLDGASSNRQRDKANESSRSESNHANVGLPDSHKRIARKPGQSLKDGKMDGQGGGSGGANPP